MKELHMRLQRMHGKPYGIYKSLQGQYWNFGDFTLKFTHIQGDPHASPSRVKLTAKLANLGFDEKLHNTDERKIALADFLLRGFQNSSGKGVGIALPHSQIMKRNSLCIENGIVSLLASVNLPGDGRRIDGEAASAAIIGTLSDYVTAAMYWNNIDEKKCHAHIECYENRNFLLSQLTEKKLVAFVPNGAIMPRLSGTSEEPLQDAVPFVSPPELEVEFHLRHPINSYRNPSASENFELETAIKGMGIPQGITVIAGGGFHGKSTLLHALEEAVYAHIPNDGREYIVIDETATPIKTEEGRVVNGTRISPLVRELPFQKSTEKFTTKNASGATSQAANLLEAIELGASSLLIDEDASAVNFLIRDLRMRELLDLQNGNKNREPLIPLTDRIKEISEHGINFIIVAGACGDYLSLADTVIAFTEYNAECLTERARKIAESRRIEQQELINGKFPPLPSLKDSRNISEENLAELQNELKPASPIEKNVKIRVNAGQISIGRLSADLRKFPTFCHPELQRAIAFILHSFIAKPPMQSSNNNATLQNQLREILTELCKSLPAEETFDLALPRPIEVGGAFLRITGNG